MPARIRMLEIVIVSLDVVFQGVECFLRDRSCRMRREVGGDRPDGVDEFLVVAGLGARDFLFFRAS